MRRSENEESKLLDAKSETDASTSEEKKVTEDTSACETSSTAGSEEHDSEGMPNFSNGICFLPVNEPIQPGLCRRVVRRKLRQPRAKEFIEPK